MKRFTFGCCAVLLLLGCRKDIQNTGAVRQGVLDYLAKRPDLVSMDVSIASVSFRKDEADALVHFSAKEGPVNNGMEMKYVLERKADRWVVKGRGNSASAANPHQGSVPDAVSPHSMPTDPSQIEPNRLNPALPPGHPPLTGQQAAPPLR